MRFLNKMDDSHKSCVAHDNISILQENRDVINLVRNFSINFDWADFYWRLWKSRKYFKPSSWRLKIIRKFSLLQLILKVILQVYIRYLYKKLVDKFEKKIHSKIRIERCAYTIDSDDASEEKKLGTRLQLSILSSSRRPPAAWLTSNFVENWKYHQK